MHFRNRTEAGQKLAEALSDYEGRRDAVLMALPRGGVPVAAEIGKSLGLPIDVMPVRKLGLPGHEEYAMGAIAEGDLYFLDQQIVAEQHVSEAQVSEIMAREHAELIRRKRLYRAERCAYGQAANTVILVDDGLATGATMRVAIAALQQTRAEEVVVAVPVGAAQSCRELEHMVARLVCPMQLTPLGSVGNWYDNFEEVTDSEVIQLLRN